MTTEASTSLIEIRHSLPLHWSTPAEWAALVVDNIDSFLVDHASCERKAHAAAMMLESKFPEYPELQDKMIGLAREELEHFHQVFHILRTRKLTLAADGVDAYVKNLFQHVRHPRQEHILDRLLATALIEARSCERFCLIAEALPQGSLKDFYTLFAIAESAHFPLFVNLARDLFGEEQSQQRIEEWLQIEAEIAKSLPIRAAVH
jgi:tRNA-(ms[2]io[6]A)-hydroxylase